MKTIGLAKLTLVAAIFFANAPVNADNQGNTAMDHSQIESVVTKNNLAVSKGDLEGALSTFEPGAVMVAQPGMPVMGTPALRAAFQQFLAIAPKVTVTGQDTVQSGDLALHTFTWKMSGNAPDGSPIEQAGFSAVVLRKQQDGQWLMAIDHPFADALLKKN
jgi:uncharacterized protein (TIGR02246 family)